MKVPPLVKALGPWSIKDIMGMRHAVVMLKRLLDKGQTERFVQFDTVRKFRLFATNASQAGVFGFNEIIGTYERNKIWMSTVETNSFWFTCFVEGFHKRVGNIVKQDKPINIQVFYTVLALLEYDYAECTSKEKVDQKLKKPSLT